MRYRKVSLSSCNAELDVCYISECGDRAYGVTDNILDSYRPSVIFHVEQSNAKRFSFNIFSIITVVHKILLEIVLLK